MTDPKLLPGSTAPSPTVTAVEVISAGVPTRQLSELPKDELEHLAADFGLDTHDFKTRQDLVTAIHARRQLIAGMDRTAMLDVIRWSRRPILSNLTKEQLAQEIVRIKSMRFDGLSLPGLTILAQLRGVQTTATDEVPGLVRKLKKQEGFFRRINRKRRGMLGSIVSNMLGESDTSAGADYQFLPPAEAAAAAHTPATAKGPPPSIKEEIEESGLFGGIAGRIKRSADDYLNQKLDEIESRIDRKLDEIDRRLAEWRDKEIANRIRIMKITLWASVIVGVFSLLYSYVTEIVKPSALPTQSPPAHVEKK